MNETAAKEWLTKAWHHYSSARILFDANHYTDIIAVEIHYAVEISLKALLIYQNKKITKTHDLLNIYKTVQDHIQLNEDDLDLLDIISEYHIGESYPTADRSMPTIDEIQKVINFAALLFNNVCTSLSIDQKLLK